MVRIKPSFWTKSTKTKSKTYHAYNYQNQHFSGSTWKQPAVWHANVQQPDVACDTLSGFKRNPAFADWSGQLTE